MSEESSEEEVLEITYVPLGDEPFGEKEMFAQGAAALDLAAIFALEEKNADALIRVAREWTRLASAVSSIEEISEDKKVIKFGFGKESIEEEENGEGSSKSDGEDQLQNRGVRFHKRRA